MQYATQKPSVFDYNDPVDFLAVTHQHTRAKNPSFSLRSWAKQLGLSHVAVLSMVLNRKRKLLPSLSSQISRQWLNQKYLNENETRYFDFLVLHANSKSDDERQFYENILSPLRPDRQFSDLSLDHFRAISDWHHFAIMEMTQLKNFKANPTDICKRLGNDITETQAADAINRLIRLDIVERTPQGGLKKTARGLQGVATPTDQPNRAIRSHHQQMITKALVAIEEQGTLERDITGHTVATNRKKIAEAKVMIEKFRKKLGNFLDSDQADSVYQINIQLFNLLSPLENSTLLQEKKTCKNQ